MKNFFNICIIRPSGYIWSSVFHEMAELLAFSLQDNGYTAQINENKIFNNTKNIIISCHLLEKSESTQIPSDSIIFNTEQVGIGSELWNQRILHFLQEFQSWDYSIHNIEKIEKIGIRPPRHFKFGYHSKLARIESDKNKDIDVLFYGALTPARNLTLKQIEASGIKVRKIYGLFGAERDAYIARSKIIINLHQHDSKIFEIIRAHYLMNNSKAIITQCDHDTKIDPDYRDGMILASHDEIVDKCFATIQSPNVIKEYEDRSLQTIMRLDSKKIIRELL